MTDILNNPGRLCRHCFRWSYTDVCACCSGLDDTRYIQELLRNLSSSRLRNTAKEVFIARERLDVGDLIGKGNSLNYNFFQRSIESGKILCDLR